MPLALPPPPRPWIARWGKRAGLYGGLVACTVLVTSFATPHHRRDLATILAQAAESGGEQSVFHEGQAYVAFSRGQGYVVTVCVRADADFAPADFVTVVRTPRLLRLEQIIPDGATSRSVLLEGDAARAYGRRLDLDLSGVEAVFARHYAAARD